MYISVLTIATLSVIFLNSYNINNIITANTQPKSGKVIISVFCNSQPLPNATICIIETSEYYYTNPNGYTKTIELPTKEVNKISVNNAKPYTEYTLLVYKNGYLPHIYYGLKITAGQTKLGVVVSLTEYGIYPSLTYTESYEFPNTSFSENIIINHKK